MIENVGAGCKSGRKHIVLDKIESTITEVVR